MLTRKQIWRMCNSREILEKLEKEEPIQVKNKSDNKQVNFKNEVKVVLIPDRKEFKNASLTNNLWYEYSDYLEFRRSYISELEKKYHTI